MKSEASRRAPVAALVLVVVLLLGGLAVYVRRAPGGPPAPAPQRSRVAARELPRLVELEAPPRRDPDRPGKLALEGFVVDERDQPVAGAIVTLDAEPPQRRETDAQGYFSIEGLLARPYAVAARKDAASLGPLRVGVAPGLEPIRLRLRLGMRIVVAVHDAREGRPLPGARVELLGGPDIAATADGTGVATLAGVGPGRFVVRATADGYAPARKDVFPTGRPAEVATLSLGLLRGALVAGTVVDPSGRPAAGARVELERAAAALFLVGDSEVARADASGQFSFPAVAAGAWRLRATHEAFAPAVSAPFDADGLTPQPRHWLQLGEGGRVAGRVVDRAGAPVPFAEVQVVADRAPSFKAMRRASCDEHGAFAIAGLPLVQLAVGATTAVASSRFAVVDLSRQPEIGDVSLVLERDGVIAGTVVGSDGAPRAEVVVRVDDDEAVLHLPETRAAALTGADGRFLLQGLLPGKHVVQAVVPGTLYPNLGDPSPRADETAGRAVVETGRRDVELVLDEGAIRGVVRFADGRSPASFTAQLDSDAIDRVHFSGNDGAFRLARIPAGAHWVKLAGPELSPKSVKAVVVADGETDVGVVVVEGGRAVRGEVRDAKGAPVAGARVIAAHAIGNELDLALGELEAYDGGKETRTDERGAFSLTGLEDDVRVIVASHPAHGSSANVALPDMIQAPIVLTLRATATLAGRLTRGGKPIQGAVTAVQTEKGGSTLARSFVTSEADGSFRIERLPAGRYTVGYGGGYRLDLLWIVLENDERTLEVDLAPGETRTLALEVPVLPLLQVQVLQRGAPVEAMAYLAPGEAPVRTGAELDALVATPGTRLESTEGWVPLRSELPPHVALFPAVKPGRRTVCARPFEDRAGWFACATVEVTPAPDRQAVTLVAPER